MALTGKFLRPETCEMISFLEGDHLGPLYYRLKDRYVQARVSLSNDGDWRDTFQAYHGCEWLL